MKPRHYLSIAASIAFCASSHAVDVTWVGTTTGNWNTTTNWSSGAAPIAGNAYIVDGAGKT